MRYDQAKQQYVIVENVVIKHNGVTIQCDSAIRKMDEGIIEGFGNIFIFQADTFTLSGGDYLRYDEASKTATVTGRNVILKDQQMTLLTTSLNYNTASQIGYYTNGADILSEKNTLKSRRGYYNRRGSVFNFKDQVQLSSPEYTMNSDTLDYYSGSRTAYFYGPTRIVSKENIITCNYGWYNTKTEKAEFSRRAAIFSDSGFIEADSLFYDKQAGLGTGIGNIRLYDSSENMDVYGQFGKYNQKLKTSVISGKPLAIKTDAKDTMYLMADTLFFSNDSLNRELRAYHKTSIFQTDFQGNCDSLVYKFSDSMIHMYHSPILWNERNQISGDTIRISIKNNSIHTLKVTGNAFLASEVKKASYNQISGREMINAFDSNKIRSVLVSGNARSIYYLRDNETDTAEYTGVNKVACGRMLILFDSSKVSAIRFFTQPEGKIYPVREFPETEKYLSGLLWQIEKKPQLETFTERKKPRAVVTQVQETVTKETVKKKKRKKK